MMPKLQDWLKRGEKRPKPKKRIAHRSKRRELQEREYRKIKPWWLALHPKCEIGPVFKAAGIAVKCRGRATHIHHRLGRIGKLLTDTTHFIASCSGECHPQAVHETHKAEARQLGLLAS